MFKLTILPEVKAVLLQAIRFSDRVRIDFSHPFSLKIKEYDLFDFDLIGLISYKIKDEKVVAFSRSEAVQIYILLDILGKSILIEDGALQNTGLAGTTLDADTKRKYAHFAQQINLRLEKDLNLQENINNSDVLWKINLQNLNQILF